MSKKLLKHPGNF